MAKRFAFRLATLLRVRARRERAAPRNLAAKRAELARLDQLNEQTAAEITRAQAELLADQRQGRLDPLALQRGRAWVAHLRRTMALRATQRAALVGQLELLAAVWREARKQKRVIEKLRERRWAEYVHERARGEQAEAEEMAQQLHVADSR